MDSNLPDQTPARNNNKTLVVIFLILAIIGVGTGVAVTQRQKPSNTNSNVQQQEKQLSAIKSPYTVVYGSWNGESSVIKAYDLQTGKQSVIADLPLNIKQVTTLSPTELLYINNTDDNDWGKELVTYSLTSKTPTTVYTAADGYGIDSYVVSPNRNYFAVWEVKLRPGSTQLSGGNSRVVAFQRGSATPTILYDEVANAPVHYPSAVTDSGEVFSDTFLPNDPKGGKGYAYGMSVARVDGTLKEDLPQMANGTYSMKPIPSADGKYLLFSGYDGTLGSGTDQRSGGTRRALLVPNTIELLDMQTKTRQKLSLSNKNSYFPNWDKASGNITFVQMAPKQPTESGVYTYNMQTRQTSRIDLGPEDTTYAYVATLAEGKTLVGTLDRSDIALGNLGEVYATPFTSFAVYDSKDSSVQLLKTNDGFMQFIGMNASPYFSDTASEGDIAQDTSTTDEGTTCNEENLQLCTFTVPSPKVSLPPKRERQQSSISCRKEYIPSVCRERGLVEDTPEYRSCFNELESQRDLLKDQGHCTISPLYLYGTPGTNVSVTIGTEVENAIPAYDGVFKVTLEENGKLAVGGKLYDSLKYDYMPILRKVTIPTKGAIVAQKDVAKTLEDYASQLGLNEKETEDLVSFAKGSVTGPYVFVSFFDQETSKRMLPISFVPKPENYMNTVFYFRQYDTNPQVSVASPVFPKPFTRSGFTAVEISAIVE